MQLPRLTGQARIETRVTVHAEVVGEVPVATPAAAKGNVDALDATKGTSSGPNTKRAGAKGALASLQAVLSPKKLMTAALLGLTLVGAATFSTPAQPQQLSTLQVRLQQAQKAPSSSLDLAPVAGAMGITDAELVRAVNYATVSRVVTAEQRIAVDGATLVIPAGTTMRASVTSSGVTLQASPAVQVELPWSPDAELSQFHYSFKDGKLDVTASGIGPDAIWSSLATDKMNALVLPLLPPELKAPNFDPRDIGHVQLVMRTLDAMVNSGGGGGALPASTWSVSLDVTPPKAIHKDLGGGISLDIPAGTDLQLSVETKRGADGRMILDSAHLDAGGSGKPPVLQRGDSKLASLDLYSISIRKNAPGAAAAFDVKADYRLAAESGIGGLVALFGAVVGAANGVSPEVGAAAALDRAGDVRLNGVRKEVDAAIQKLSAPIAELLGSLAPGLGVPRT